MDPPGGVWDSLRLPPPPVTLRPVPKASSGSGKWKEEGKAFFVCWGRDAHTISACVLGVR